MAGGMDSFSELVGLMLMDGYTPERLREALESAIESAQDEDESEEV